MSVAPLPVVDQVEITLRFNNREVHKMVFDRPQASWEINHEINTIETMFGPPIREYTGVSSLKLDLRGRMLPIPLDKPVKAPKRKPAKKRRR